MSIGNNYIISGRYRIEKELGRGGMGIVYLAYDLDSSQYVAVKILKSSVSSESAFIRFKNEIFSIVRLDHPNIIHVYDAGFDSNIYYVMQYIDGTDLSKELHTKDKLDITETLHIAYQISAALDYAHGKGFFHRDVKPENILLDKNNNAFLVDFGITTSDSLPHVTQGFIGTVEYSSPEHCSGGVITGKSDQYSLAVVVYEMLTGRPPFVSEGGNSVAIAIKHINEMPPDPREFCPTITENTAKAILKALSKQPEKRFPSCNAFVSCMAGMSLDYFSTGKLAASNLMPVNGSFSTSRSTIMKKIGLIPKKIELSGTDKNSGQESILPDVNKPYSSQLKPKIKPNANIQAAINADKKPMLPPKPILQSSSSNNPEDNEAFKNNLQANLKDISFNSDTSNIRTKPLQGNSSQSNQDFLSSLYSDVPKQRVVSASTNMIDPNKQQKVEQSNSADDDDFLRSLSPISADGSINSRNPFLSKDKKEEDSSIPRNQYSREKVEEPRSKDDDDFLSSLSPISSDGSVSPRSPYSREKKDDDSSIPRSPYSREKKEDESSTPRSPYSREKVEEPRSKDDDDFLSSLSPISSDGSVSPRKPYSSEKKEEDSSISRNPYSREKVEQPHSQDDDFLSSLSPISADGSVAPRSPYSREKKEGDSSIPRSPYSREKKEGDSSTPRSPYSREKKDDESSTPRSPYSREKKDDESVSSAPYNLKKKEEDEVPKETHLINPEEKKENLIKDTPENGEVSEIERKKEELRDKFKGSVPSDFMKSSTENSDSSDKKEQESSGKLNFNDIYKDKEKSKVLEEEKIAVLKAANGNVTPEVSATSPASDFLNTESKPTNPLLQVPQPQNQLPETNLNTLAGAGEQKNSNSSVILIACVIIFALICGIGFFTLQKDHYKLGNKYYIAGNYEKAIENYEKAKNNKKLTLDNQQSVILNLFDSYAKTNKIDKAIEYANILKEQYPDIFDGKSEVIANVYKTKADSTEDYETKADFYNKVLEVNPNDMESAEVLADLYNEHEEVEKAEKLYLDLLSKTEDKGKIYSSLATMFSKQNNSSKALSYFQKADKEGGEIDYAEYVKVLKGVGKKKEALAVINKIAGSHPDLATDGAVIALDLADSLKDKQDSASKNKVLEYIKTAKKLSQNSVDEKFNEVIESGSDLISKKNYSKAVNVFEYALKMKGDSGKAWYKYLSALYKAGYKDSVINNSGKALKFNASDSAATSEIKKWVAQINQERAAAAQAAARQRATYSQNNQQHYSSSSSSYSGSSSGGSYSRSSREYDNPSPAPAPQRRRATTPRNTISIPKIPSNYFKPVKKGQQRDVQSIPSSGD